MKRLLILMFAQVLVVNSVLPDDSPFRWNLIPKKLLKRLCNLDDSLPICAWKRHLPASNGKEVYSKWQICRDHPELNICKWQNGGFVTIPQTEESLAGATTTTAVRLENSAEAPPTSASASESIFVNEPNMMLSSKWSNRQDMEQTLKKELNSPEPRFDGQLRSPSENESDDVPTENFDETIMSANEGVFSI